MDVTVTPTQRVQLRNMVPRAARAIWQRDHEDAGWLLPDRSDTAWRAWLEQMHAAELLGHACVRALYANNRLLGYATLQSVEDTYMPDGQICVEGGTYLRCGARGQGWNAAVKQVIVQFAWSGQVLAPVPDWCVFVVPTSNQRAVAAMRKLELPWVIEEGGDGGVFERLIRRKSWEVSQTCMAFALQRTQITVQRR